MIDSSNFKQQFEGFNRTFMELKSANAVMMNAKEYCFNRTFMELKYQNKRQRNHRQMF